MVTKALKVLPECKVCNKCKQEKPLASFYPNKGCKQGVTGTCRDCSRVRINKWYSDNRDRRQNVANVANQLKKRNLVLMFGDKCLDCDTPYPDYVYDFHHLDPSTKDVNPSKALTWSAERAKEELDKCVMLCANCHRIRHHNIRKEL